MRRLNSPGFTLIEMLVVIGITMFLSSMVLFYTRGSEKQIGLYKDQAVIVGVLNRAKSLAIQKYSKSSTACAFGVHIPPSSQDFFLFEDRDTNCVVANHVYDLGEEIQKFSLEPAVRFVNVPASGLDIVFIPPENMVSSTVPLPTNIVLGIPGTTLQSSITISIVGQISPN